MTRIVLATHNDHKVHELRLILGDTLAQRGLEIVGMSQFPEVGDVAETEVTFAGNAALKAVTVAQATGFPAIADDSGLAVEVLGGCPGVFSARWSGNTAGVGAPRAVKDRANLELLLAQIADVPDEHRAAAFVCAAAFAQPSGEVVVREGSVSGHLVRVPRGDGGFGYDPIFVPEGSTRTMAEHSDAEKNAISHRARAFAALAPLLA